MIHEFTTYNFQGPLDLLLHLIKEADIDIFDINIAEITNQYLSYIENMESLNLNVDSEYLVMAAELIEMKSKILLPYDDNSDTEEEEDDSYDEFFDEKDDANEQESSVVDFKNEILQDV